MCVTSLASHGELEYGNALDSGAPLPGVRSFATLTHATAELRAHACNKHAAAGDRDLVKP